MEYSPNDLFSLNTHADTQNQGNANTSSSQWGKSLDGMVPKRLVKMLE